MGGLPKAFMKLGGRELIYYSLDIFRDVADETVIVLPVEEIPFWEKKLRRKYKGLKFAAGGEYRQDSVKNALDIMPDSKGLVLVHDVARPFLEKKVLDCILEGAEKYGACIPCIEARDTVKEVDGGFVKSTPERKNIVQVQTPQAFRADILRAAYAMAYKDDFYGSDDSALVERLGVKVYLVRGGQDNIKITYPADVKLAKTILKKWKTAE